MKTIDWDDFFERKQFLAYSLLVGAYERELSTVRSKPYGRQVYSALFLAGAELQSFQKAGIDLYSIEDDTPDIKRLNKLERSFYDGLFMDFCHTWLLNRDNPVAVFVQRLNEAVANYVVPLLISVDDWEAAHEAQQKSNSFNGSRLAVQRILRWIVWRFVAIRFRTYLLEKGTLPKHLPERQLLVDEEFESVFAVEIKLLNKRHVLSQTIIDRVKGQPRVIREFLYRKPIKKRRSETMERDDNMFKDYIAMIDGGKDPKEARMEVAKMYKVNERTFFRALEIQGY